MPPLNKENWKEEFDKKFTNIMPYREDKRVKAFIAQLLAAQEDRVRKSYAERAMRLKKEVPERYNGDNIGNYIESVRLISTVSGYNVACEDIVREIEGK